MTDNTKKWIAWAIVAAAVLVAGFLGVQYPMPDPPESPLLLASTEGVTNFDSLTLGEDLIVTDDSTLTDDVSIGGDLTVTGAATLSGDVIVDDTLNLDELANTATGSTTITPTTTYYQLAPTALLTITLATGSAAAGDLLILHNTVTTNTNIVDTGATVGGGAIDLGANDLAIFIYGNSKWIELASPDNS